jgi:two-component system sensor histidine kinase/response regulator
MTTRFVGGPLLAIGRHVRETLAARERPGLPAALEWVHMPELDGFGVARAPRVREQTTGRHLPVIAVTARARAEDRQRCVAAGMDGFIAKPISAAELWAEIDRFARGAKRRTGSWSV